MDTPRRLLTELGITFLGVQGAMWTLGWTRTVFLVLTFSWVALTNLAQTRALRIKGFGFSGLRQTALWVLPISLILALGVLLVAKSVGTYHEQNFARHLGGYFVKALIQQLGIVYLYLRFSRLTSPTQGGVITALMFALFHLPNPILIPLTFGVCVGWCALYHRYRNLYALAASHALLGTTIMAALPSALTHNMRVGIGYLIYQGWFSIADAQALVIRVTSVLLTLGLTALMFFPGAKIALETLWLKHPRWVIALPLGLLLLYLGFWQQTGLNTLMMGAYLFTPVLVFWPKHSVWTTTWRDALVLGLIWLPFDFHLIGGWHMEPWGSDWFFVCMEVTALVAILWRCFRHLHGMKTNLEWRSQDLWLTLMVFAVLAAVLIPLALFSGFAELRDTNVLILLRPVIHWKFPLLLLGIAVTTAAGEEVIFRGVIQNLLSERWALLSLVITSLMFGAIHLHKGSLGWYPWEWNWLYGGLATIAGLGYGLVYQKTRSLVCPILLHAGVDATWHTLFR